MASLNDNALTTLQMVKDTLGITSSDQDAFLIRQINRASDLFERATGRNWYNTDGDYAEKVPGAGRPRLQVYDHLPVTSITSVVYDDGDDQVTIDTTEYDLENEDLGFIRNLNGVWVDTNPDRVDINRHQVPSNYEPNYTVTYQGGYITQKQEDDGVGTRNLPYDVEEAVIAQVTVYYDQKGRDTSIKSLKVGDGSITWASEAMQTKYGLLAPSFKAFVQEFDAERFV